MSDALLIVGHGSRSGHADDVLPYYVDFFRADFDEVMACYLEQEPRIDDALSRIRSDRVFVMPLLIAHGYHTRVTIPRALGIESARGFSHGKEIFLLEPMGRSEHIVKIIKERIGEAKK
jgi:sirohydrochlorin cobaltochelatase